MMAMLAEIGNTWFLPFENSFILWLQSLGGKDSFIYYIMSFFTMFGEELILIVVLALVYFGFDKVRGERLGAMLMTTSLFTPLIKNIVCRTRPFDSESGILNLRDVDGYSFPSGHSSSSAATFGGVAKLFGTARRRWLWIFGIGIPVLVALSRNYLGAHYLTDVICGLALGFGIVFLLNWLLEKFNNYIIYGIIGFVGLAGMFYCTTSDYFTGYGLFVGFVTGITIEKRFVKFDNTRVWWRILLRLIFAGALFLGINELVKLPFDSVIYDNQGIIYDNMVIFERIFRTVRYIIVTTTVIGIYPLTFRLMDKVWLKLGWIKPKDIPSATNE